jgi:hypothetical protein
MDPPALAGLSEPRHVDDGIASVWARALVITTVVATRHVPATSLEQGTDQTESQSTHYADAMQLMPTRHRALTSSHCHNH